MVSPAIVQITFPSETDRYISLPILSADIGSTLIYLYRPVCYLICGDMKSFFSLFFNAKKMFRVIHIAEFLVKISYFIYLW